MEAAAAKSARELAEYKAESSQLRNQDLTIRRLEEKARQLEAQLQEKVAACGLSIPTALIASSKHPSCTHAVGEAACCKSGVPRCAIQSQGL